MNGAPFLYKLTCHTYKHMFVEALVSVIHIFELGWKNIVFCAYGWMKFILERQKYYESFQNNNNIVRIECK